MPKFLVSLAFLFFGLTTQASILECNAEDIFSRVLKMDMEKNEIFLRFAGANPNDPHTWQSVYFGDRFCAMKFNEPETIHCPFTRQQSETGSLVINLACQQNSTTDDNSPTGQMELDLENKTGTFVCGAQGGTRFRLKLSACKIL